ncbi:MAG: DUF1844 domain-containing protein [Candidatus Acidiferrales bacterium]
MADEKQEQGFKVVDRRLFSESGEVRREIVEAEERETEAAAKKAAAAAKFNAKTGAAKSVGGSASGGSTLVGAGGAALDRADAGDFGSATGGAALEGADAANANSSSRSFQMLVDFLTRNAAAMLGGMADPRTGQAFLDLEGAREMIDMLDALREKTRGNLSKEDDQLLLEVLGSLKLTFMEVSKAAAEQMAKKAGKKA